MKHIIVIVIALSLSFTAYASDQYLSLGISYIDISFPEKLNDYGGSFIFSGYNNTWNIVLGGYGGLIATKNIQLGIGGALIGFGFNILEQFNFTVTGKAGLGGGIYYNMPGATYQFGCDFNIGVIKNTGFGLSLSYDKIYNLYKIDNIDSKGEDIISFGLKYIIKLIK